MVIVVLLLPLQLKTAQVFEGLNGEVKSYVSILDLLR